MGREQNFRTEEGRDSGGAPDSGWTCLLFLSKDGDLTPPGDLEEDAVGAVRL